MTDNYNCEECKGYKAFTCDRYEMVHKNSPLCLYKDALNKLKIKKSELESTIEKYEHIKQDENRDDEKD